MPMPQKMAGTNNKKAMTTPKDIIAMAINL